MSDLNQTFKPQYSPNQTIKIQRIPNQTFKSHHLPNQTLKTQHLLNQNVEYVSQIWYLISPSFSDIYIPNMIPSFSDIYIPNLIPYFTLIFWNICPKFKLNTYKNVLFSPFLRNTLWEGGKIKFEYSNLAMSTSAYLIKGFPKLPPASHFYPRHQNSPHRCMHDVTVTSTNYVIG